jgi:hypothetical protein
MSTKVPWPDAEAYRGPQQLAAWRNFIMGARILPDVGVLYLYRFTENEILVRNFLDSYRDNPAGLEHDLHVIFKGFPDQNAISSARALFGNLPVNPIVLDDSGFDIGSYLAAAKVVSNRRLMFFKASNRILAPNWLHYFDRALSLPRAGVVGATGSWEAYASDIEGAVITALRRIGHRTNDSHSRVATKAFVRNDEWQRPKRPLKLYLFSPFYYLYYLYQSGRYPNPHIRPNSFMIERDRFLSLRVPSFFSKNDALQFESERGSMTRQIIAQGLRPLIMDRTGKTFDIPDWNSSKTFRSGGQVNLIVEDNRTREYASASPEFRRILENQAWVHPWSWGTSPVPTGPVTISQ